MASVAKPIPLKGFVESLGDVASAMGDNSMEVHMQFEQMALLDGKPSNDCIYTTTRQRHKERGNSVCDRGMQRVHAP